MDHRRDRTRCLRWSAAVVFVSSFSLFLLSTDTAVADEGLVTDPTVLAQQVQDSPYQPPENEEIEPPPWLAPLGPVAELPLWAVAAVLSAGLAGLVIIVPMAARWIWKLGPDKEPRA